MRRHRVLELVTARGRGFALALVLASSLVSTGCLDCDCGDSVPLVDPVGWGPRAQPFETNAYYLFAFDAGPTLGPRVGLKGIRPSILDGSKWIAPPRLTLEGKSFFITGLAREDDEYFYLGSDRGLVGYNVKYGSLRQFTGLPSSNPAISTLIKRPQGGVFAGLDSAASAGIPLLYLCQTAFSASVCSAAAGSPVSTKAGDGVKAIRGFPGPPYYVLTTVGTKSSPDGINFFAESLPTNATNYGIGGVDGNLVVTTSLGAHKGAGHGGAWSADNTGLGQGCAGVTFIDPWFYVVCNYPDLQVYKRLKTETAWTSTLLALNPFVAYGYGLERDGNRVILGTTRGAYAYENNVWTALDDCLKRASYALALDVFGSTLGVGGNLTGYAESTDAGKTWTSDPSSLRLSARYVATSSQGTYITGSTGTWLRPTGQQAFQEVTVPGGAAASLGKFGDTVLGGLGSGGVGRLVGTSYVPENSGFDTTAYVNGFASSPGTVVALTNKGNFFATASYSWTRGANRSDGQPFVGYKGIPLTNGNVLLGGYANPSGWNIALSSPSGTSLTAAGQGIPDGAYVYDLAEAANSSPVQAGFAARSAAAASSVLFAATSQGLYVSYDGAASWSVLSRALGTAPVYALAVDGSRLWVGTAHRGVTSYSLPIRFRRLVPIVLDVDTGSAHYTTELALTNHGTTAAEVSLQYTAAESLGGAGSGTVSDSIAAGRQLIIPNVLDYLRGKNLAIPAGGAQGGTLLLTFSNVSATTLPIVTARTTAATGPPFPVGRAGLAYGAIDPEQGSSGSLTVYGLRSNTVDRSNVAVYNTSNQPVTFKVTATSGAGGGASAVIAASDTLPPWGWKQYNAVLDGPGFAQGWVTVERVSTAGSFGIYGVINDNKTNDGSVVDPAANPAVPSYVNLPVLVETGSFVSELVLANSDAASATFHVEYTESLAGSGGGSTNISVPAKSQLVIPNAIDYLRTHGIPIGAGGSADHAGSLHVEVSGASLVSTYVGARTSAPSPAGGAFGLFTPSIVPGAEGDTEATINGLRSDAENRSNVAAVNTGDPDDGDITLSIQAYDGDAGGAPKGPAVPLTLKPGQWQQLNNFLGRSDIQVANGWVKLTRTAGSAPWIAYGAINDGAAPGQRTSDGAAVAMVK